MVAPETKQAGDIVGSLNSMAFPQPLLYAALGGYASNTGVPVTPFTALQSAAVYGCTKCISEDIACLPVQVRRKTADGEGWVIDRQHPLNRLFRRPNRLMTAFQFWAYLLTAYCLRGNAYAVIERDRNGAPVELIPVTPDRVTVRLSVVDGSPWYLVNAKQIGIGVWVAPEDMLHMRNMSVDGYLGLSPIACAQDVIGLSLAAQQHGAILFRQGGQISGVLKHPGRLGKEAADNLAESWRDDSRRRAERPQDRGARRGDDLRKDRDHERGRAIPANPAIPGHRYLPDLSGPAAQARRVRPRDVQQPRTAAAAIHRRLPRAAYRSARRPDERSAAFRATSATTWETHFDFTGLLRGDTIRRYQSYQIGLLNGFLSRNEVRASREHEPDPRRRRIPGPAQHRKPARLRTSASISRCRARASPETARGNHDPISRLAAIQGAARQARRPRPGHPPHTLLAGVRKDGLRQGRKDRRADPPLYDLDELRSTEIST